MNKKIKVGIVGYGNMGRGVESAIKQNPDIELVAVFTRRPPQEVKLQTKGVKTYSIRDAAKFQKKIDVMILCGGSATDLPEQGPLFAGKFNTIDSFDTHAKIPEYFKAVDRAAKKGGKACIISVGWDPGFFSMIRLMGESILPEGKNYTFWGKGLSQGHSDAIRRVKGVKNGVQYTIPIESAIQKVRSGMNPVLTTRQKHKRECFVVAEEGANKAQIVKEIKTMPNYFADYDTTVHFINEKELQKNHSTMPHGGFVFRTGLTGEKEASKEILEFSLKLDSNPEFTASVLVAFARAVVRMNRNKDTGAKTVFDVPIGYLSYKSPVDLRKELL
jgi:diaminopimelate dehydrogenase